MDGGAIEPEDGRGVLALETVLELRELCVDGMAVEAVEKVEFVGFAFEDIEDFREDAEFGGSWSRFMGGVDVVFGLVDADSSPPS